MRLPPRTERDFAVQVVQALQAAGHDALFAGGCVRDELLGYQPKDYDIATAALPEDVMALFRRTIAVGAAFGVVEVLGPRPFRVQVATFRRDGNYSDARRPDEVIFSTAEEDAKRRDFTINGMFLDPLSGKVIDFVDGRADLEARVLRAIGDPYERFREDRLRLLRAVRMTARFGLHLEPNTQRAIVHKGATISEGVSAERIAEELRKMLTDPNRVRAMRLLMELDLAAAILPELLALRDQSASLGNRWEHTLNVLGRLQQPSFPLAFAALLHGVGRQTTNAISLRLRLSNDERERAEWLIEHQHAMEDVEQLRPAQLKTLLVHRGIDELIALHRCLAQADGRDERSLDLVEQRRSEWQAAGTLCPPPLLTGHDLLAMGIPQGPAFRVLLEKVREAQLNDTLMTPEEARDLVRHYKP
ncbi:MAG: CCA tRNA nucleotidyltransferase [Planctomycetia bacterium]|nr:CCA tRNA nucleotidyltransferase [Planctomycetia bacterium]